MITAALFFIASALWDKNNSIIAGVLFAFAICITIIKIMQAFGV